MGLIKTTVILFLSLVFIFVSVSAGLYFFYNNEVSRVVSVSSNKNLIIKKGMSVDEIGEYLKGEGLIRYPYVLKAYLYLNGDRNIQAGSYVISDKEITLPKLVDIMRSGSFTHKLTFIEGWRASEYTDYLRKQLGASFADSFAKSNTIKEGYMFPDTYTIDAGYKPEDLASWMRSNFDKKAKANNWEQKAMVRGLDMDEVITMASIVEREMHIHNERPKVAGILVKRMQQGWALQADATLQYAKGTSSDWWPIVSRDDLRTLNSPYNSYMNKGLPPGPICNPSLDSIEAVLNYQETPYWFYVTGKDGVTHYSVTLEEHNANVAKYL